MELAEYATMAAAEERHWWYRGLRALVRDAWDRHVEVAGARLLDVGCGTGANLLALADRSLAAGIDVEPEAIAWCRQRGLALTAVGTATALPFPDASFDVVLSCDVLSHQRLPDRLQPVAEMARVLRPGGRLLLNVPACQWLLSSHDRAVQMDRRFSRRDIDELLRRAGLVPLRVTCWNTALFPIAAAVRLVRRVTRPGGSDLAAGSGAGAGAVLGSVLAAERRLLAHVDLPIGLSVFAVAAKPEA